ncbi:tRNA lysidine(34) synthetase TilS [Spirochaeta africana]|uniref:tRNA(Ile)-lysidine synthase n=1 Tax=Spirochaeta africana (strain ATCC 700263 / DSM 8902 / Z-7692) TaxID=889378 RepID=H9UK86_SPIAZ|nr:tRNA lysidine(34) synthetase TilS [Spirochaeta africana]AFG37929.1 tRNA(Ile)-lysidine synthetase [Spirochaeta africana DSM 8902]
MQTLLQQIDSWWDDQRLPRHAPVVAACSGGRDSMLLLHLLCELRNRQRIGPVSAAWYDHALREPDEIDRERQLIENSCQDLGVPLYQGRADSREIAQLCADLGMEAAARQLRYQFLEGVCQECTADLLAVAHHAGDQLETMLMRLCGGSGIEGLGGIAPVRSRGGTSEVAIIRPLLAAEQAEIAAAAADLSYHTDSTNTDIRIIRNNIRHMVVPQLQQLYPEASRSAVRLARDIRDVTGWLEDFLPLHLEQTPVYGGGFSLDLERLLQLPGVLRVGCLQRLRNQLVPESTGRVPRTLFAPVEQLGQKDGVSPGNRGTAVARHVATAAGIEIYTDQGRLFVFRRDHVHSYWSQWVPVEAGDVPSGQPHGADRQLCDQPLCDRIADDLRQRGISPPYLLRSPVSGDRLPSGTSLKRVFQRRAVPAFLRSRCIVLETRSGEISVILDPEGRLLWADRDEGES